MLKHNFLFPRIAVDFPWCFHQLREELLKSYSGNHADACRPKAWTPSKNRWRNFDMKTPARFLIRTNILSRSFPFLPWNRRWKSTFWACDRCLPKENWNTRERCVICSHFWDFFLIWWDATNSFIWKLKIVHFSFNHFSLIARFSCFTRDVLTLFCLKILNAFIGPESDGDTLQGILQQKSEEQENWVISRMFGDFHSKWHSVFSTKY